MPGLGSARLGVTRDQVEQITVAETFRAVVQVSKQGMVLLGEAEERSEVDDHIGSSPWDIILLITSLYSIALVRTSFQSVTLFDAWHCHLSLLFGV